MIRDKMKRPEGLTLTELVLVVAILSILTAVAVPTVRISIKRQKEIELQRALRVIRSAIDDYRRAVDNGLIESLEEELMGYPPDLETLVEGVPLMGLDEEKSLKFLRRIPKDPFMNSYEWRLKSYQDEADSDSWGGENVFDVCTMSEGTALDGTKYKDW
jgi:general secretion pathway protein G